MLGRGLRWCGWCGWCGRPRTGRGDRGGRGYQAFDLEVGDAAAEDVAGLADVERADQGRVDDRIQPQP
jgi:hypothetical protein